MSESQRPSPEQIKETNKLVIAQFRESGGVGSVGPIDFGRCVLLTTTGRRTGQARTVPLGFARTADGDLILFGSNLGAPRDPDWVRNIEADPGVTVELTGASWSADAEILQGDARADAYRRWLEVVPHTADHEERAGRPIPMIRVPQQS